MKEYFTKFLPDKSEAKVGDLFRSESISKHVVKCTGFTDDGSIITDEQEMADPFGGSYYIIRKEKAIKLTNQLFLCTKNIKTGDKIKCPDGIEREISYFDSILPYGIWNFTDGNYGPADQVFKIVGIISPEAFWVKENEEFNEEDIKYYMLEGELEGKEMKKNTILSFVGNSFKNVGIKVKGPCGHFH